MSLFSCKPSVPSEYIQPNEMEDILFDYYIVQSIQNNTSHSIENQNVNNEINKLAVLKKHNVSEAQYDSSLVYYFRHTERMHKIYENLAKRLGNDVVSLGASSNGIGNNDNLTATGDTANIWEGNKSVILTSLPPYNSLSFTMKADSAYHKGDMFMLNFDCQFIFQDGMRDGVAMLSVRFSNDSVYSQIQHVSSNSHLSLMVQDLQHLGIKQISGFFYLTGGQNNQTQTLKLMGISNIRLIRIHVKQDNRPTQVNSSNAIKDSSMSSSSSSPSSGNSANGDRVNNNKVVTDEKEQRIESWKRQADASQQRR